MSLQAQDNQSIDQSLTANSQKTAVLCIEAEPNSMLLAFRLLDPTIYDVVWAKSIEEGYELAKFYGPQIMLIDTEIEGKVGQKFVNQINQWARSNGFPQQLLLLVKEAPRIELDHLEIDTAVDVKQISYQILPQFFQQI